MRIPFASNLAAVCEIVLLAPLCVYWLLGGKSSFPFARIYRLVTRFGIHQYSEFGWVKVTWVQLHYSGEQSAALAEKLKEVFFTFFGHSRKSNIWIFMQNTSKFLFFRSAYFSNNFALTKPLRFLMN